MRNKKLKRILNLFLVIAVILSFSFNSFAISAHAANQTVKVTKQVNSYMSAIKRYDIKKIKKMLIDNDCLHVTDKKMQKHIRRINRECLNYEIRSVKVRGKTATVSLYVTQYNIQSDFEYAIRETIWEYDKTWTSDKISKKINKYLRENYHPEDDAEYFEYNAKIRLAKKGNRWMICKMDKNTVLFKDASLAYFLEDFSKNPYKYI